jgi:hypothetical protein
MYSSNHKNSCLLCPLSVSFRFSTEFSHETFCYCMLPTEMGGICYIRARNMIHLGNMSTFLVLFRKKKNKGNV